MKHLSKTALTAAILALLLLLTACGQTADGSGDTGYVINQSNIESPADEILAFYEGNTSLLTDLVNALTESGVYAFYDYQTKFSDDTTTTPTFSVQMQVKTQTSAYWTVCDDKTANRLCDVKYVGRVYYDPEENPGVVILTPRLGEGMRLSLVWCDNSAGLERLEQGGFHGGNTVTVEKLATGWYRVTAEEVGA